MWAPCLVSLVPALNWDQYRIKNPLTAFPERLANPILQHAATNDCRKINILQTEYLASDCKKVTLKEFSLKAWNKYLRLVTPVLLMALKEIQVYLSRSFIAFQHKRFEKKISSKSNLDALTTWFFFALDQTLYNLFWACINFPKMISQKFWVWVFYSEFMIPITKF